jgi:AmmeMemoRadiSam system protein A
VSDVPAFEPLDERDQRELLRIARATLREHLATGYLPPGSPHRKTLLQPAGAFVTVKVNGRLRGCMGRVMTDKPLYLTIEELAVAAAKDPRFEPLRIEELKETRLTVSVLTPPEPAKLETLEIGKHGVVITRGARRGLLLPEVAREHGLGPAEFLDEACIKAGLSPGAWRESDTQIERFTATAFSEPED